jgi:hypothetical protein
MVKMLNKKGAFNHGDQQNAVKQVNVSDMMVQRFELDVWPFL